MGVNLPYILFISALILKTLLFQQLSGFDKPLLLFDENYDIWPIIRAFPLSAGKTSDKIEINFRRRIE